MKYAQAVISQTVNGSWKITFHSLDGVERGVYGKLETIIKELKDAATREWERRSIE